jgi:hypothetical protein
MLGAVYKPHHRTEKERARNADEMTKCTLRTDDWNCASCADPGRRCRTRPIPDAERRGLVHDPRRLVPGWLVGSVSGDPVQQCPIVVNES